MKLIKTTSLFNDVSDVQYKFYVPDLEADETYQKKRGRSKYSSCKDVVKTVENAYAYVYPFCKKCNSRKVIEWGFNDKLIIDENGKKHNITVQRYKCSSCGKFSQTEFKDSYDPYCNLSNNSKNKSVKNHGVRPCFFAKYK